MCVDVRRDMCVEPYVDMCVDMCVDIRVDLHIDMCVIACVDMCLSMLINLCAELALVLVSAQRKLAADAACGWRLALGHPAAETSSYSADHSFLMHDDASR